MLAGVADPTNKFFSNASLRFLSENIMYRKIVLLIIDSTFCGTSYESSTPVAVGHFYDAMPSRTPLGTHPKISY